MTMLDVDAMAAERLELLSNTAMLEKGMERKGHAERIGTNNLAAFSRYEKPDNEPLAHTNTPPETPRPAINMQGREMASPQVVAMENSRESPPLSAGGRNQYCGGATTPFRAFNDYPPFPPLHGHFVSAPQADTYYRTSQAPVPGPLSSSGRSMADPHGPSHPAQLQHHGGSKESTALHQPQDFRSPYEDRRLEMRPLSGSSSRSNFFSPPTISVSEDTEDPSLQGRATYEALLRENFQMREQLRDRDAHIATLQHHINQLKNEVHELRQLPTGKISHIPVDDMVRIMQEYGSEVSNQTLPKRRDDIKKASIVRQFRRWNPEFFHWFVHVNGEWVPKLGREGELKRRAQKRLEIKRQGNLKKSSSSSSTASG